MELPIRDYSADLKDVAASLWRDVVAGQAGSIACKSWLFLAVFADNFLLAVILDYAPDIRHSFNALLEAGCYLVTAR